MRVISQDGTLDMPYEQVIIQRFKDEIYFLNKNLTGVEHLVGDMVAAKYSTEEKAQKAMSELKYAYLSHNQLQITREIPKAVSDVFPDKMINAVYGAFQFPAEEELE